MAQIRDPKAMRALAHPLRVRLLHALTSRLTATATELSEVVGESPANCSFHLRTLAEHGYIERADDATGREKPWRVVDPEQNFDADLDDDESRDAMVAVNAAFREHALARVRARDARRLSGPWAGTSYQGTATVHLTPDETRELHQKLRELIEPYVGRITDPGARPDGSEPVQFLGIITPLLGESL